MREHYMYFCTDCHTRGSKPRCACIDTPEMKSKLHARNLDEVAKMLDRIAYEREKNGN